MTAARPSGRTFGVDEAGRGPIIGPMAIGVVATSRGAVRKLKRLGVADSKDFGSGDEARSERAQLAAEIREVVPGFCVRLVSVETIDRYVYRGQLNALERKVALEMLRELGAERDERVICDGKVLFADLGRHFPRLRAVNNGEAAHVSVAAASILAKDERDKAMAKIAAKYEEEFGAVRGGGYLNAATRRFLDAYRERYGELPPEARKSWGADKLPGNLTLFDEPAARAPD